MESLTEAMTFGADRLPTSSVSAEVPARVRVLTLKVTPAPKLAVAPLSSVTPPLLAVKVPPSMLSTPAFLISSVPPAILKPC